MLELHPEPVGNLGIGSPSGSSGSHGVGAKLFLRQAHLLEHLQHISPQRLVGDGGAVIDLLPLMPRDCGEQGPVAIL